MHGSAEGFERKSKKREEAHKKKKAVAFVRSVRLNKEIDAATEAKRAGCGHATVGELIESERRQKEG